MGNPKEYNKCLPQRINEYAGMKYKFGDIIYNITEKKKPTEDDRPNYIGLENLYSGSLFVARWGAERTPEGEKIVMKKGDVLFGKRRAYQKKVAISPIDGVFSAHGMVLRPKENVICKEFLPFFISSDYFLNEAIRISVGGLSPTINWKDIKELEFNLPSIDEQKVLAEKLWAAYEVKQSYLKMIDATDEMIKAQFIEMFGDEIIENIKWEVLTMDQVFDISSSKRVLKDEWTTSGVPFLRVRDMVDLSLGKPLNNEAFISEDHYNSLKDEDGKLRPGDIILSATSTIGKCYLVKENDQFYYKDADVLRFRRKREINDAYFMFAFNMPTVARQVEESIGKTTVGHFLISKAQKIKMPLPPIDLQKRFDIILTQADKSKAELRKSIDAIDKVIKSLINENL